MENPTPTKKPPFAALLALLVPVIALAVYVAVGSTDGDERSAADTTLSQAGDPDAPSTTADGDDSGASPEGPGGSDAADGGAGASEGESASEVPSRPGVAGSEGDRPVVTYPQPTVPEGGCSRPSGTVTIVLSSAPSPACLQLGADQAVIVRNRTGREIAFVAIGVNETIAAGSEARIGRALDAFGDGRSTFWSPGNPQLSGIVEVG